MPTEAEIIEALRPVEDPELHRSIVDLGMVKGVAGAGPDVQITIALTTPGCPMERIITDGILNAVAAVPIVEHVLPNLVWEPRWHPGMMKEESW